MDTADTIAAIATPPGPSLRGMVRISGPEAWAIGLTGFEADHDPPDRMPVHVRVGSLKIGGLRPYIPASVALWPGPRTYTGEPLAEIGTIGSPAVLQALLADRLSLGARLAEPGEFTLRAFLSGRIDLTRAEAVLGVIEADDPARLQAALGQMAGNLATPIEALRDRLLDVLAHLEAGLDFVDEADVDPIARAGLAGELARGASTLLEIAGQFSGRDRPGSRPRVVLVGPPNSGKSRLFNRLVGEDRAIVSPVAGTTRDYLSAGCDCDGLTVDLIDTAGIEGAGDPILDRGQAFRVEQVDRADLLLDCAAPGSARSAIDEDSRSLLVRTKADLGGPEIPGEISTSAIDGSGVDVLLSAIASALRAPRSSTAGLASTGARCRDGLLRAGQFLRDASESIRSDRGEEFVALDLRQSVEELGRVVGVEVGDEVLDRVFRKFCIGK